MSFAETALPSLDSAYHITSDQAGEYDNNGHILLRDVVRRNETEAYRQIISNAVQTFNTEQRAMEDRDAYGKAFLQVTNLWERDAGVRRFSFAKRFAKMAADLLGVNAVRIYHDQALFKEPGGGPTPWHQDQFYWPLNTDKTITMWMPLVDCPIELGALTFASGSHRSGYLCPLGISEKSAMFFEDLVSKEGYPIAVENMRAGDATFHAGWTLHKAPGNKLDVMREVMTIIYFEDGARVIEPDHEARQADLERWLPGLKPGDLAACELTPIVYQR